MNVRPSEPFRLQLLIVFDKKNEELVPHVGLGTMMVVELQLDQKVFEDIRIKGKGWCTDVRKCQTNVVHRLLEMLSTSRLQRQRFHQLLDVCLQLIDAVNV